MHSLKLKCSYHTEISINRKKKTFLRPMFLMKFGSPLTTTCKCKKYFSIYHLSICTVCTDFFPFPLQIQCQPLSALCFALATNTINCIIQASLLSGFWTARKWQYGDTSREHPEYLFLIPLMLHFHGLAIGHVLAILLGSAPPFLECLCHFNLIVSSACLFRPKGSGGLHC